MFRSNAGLAAAVLLAGVAAGGDDESRRRPPGATVTGRALSEPGGKPAAGVLVTLWNDSGGGERTARTDDNGAYSFPDVRPGGYKVWIEERAGKVAGVWSEAVVLRVAAAPVRAEDVYAALPQSISGTVTDADTGKPVAGADINFSTPDGNRAGVATGADGRYRLFVTPRQVELCCYGTRERYAPAEPRPRVAVAAGKHVAGVDFKVKSAPPFAGRVVLPDGKPAAGAEVMVELRWPPARGVMYDSSGRSLGYTTDGDGRFSGYMGGAWGRETVDLKVLVRTPDHRVGGVVRAAATAAGGYRLDPLDVVLARSAGVLVRVADPDGNPVRNAAVVASHRPNWDFGWGGPVKHAGDGKYLMMGLVPGLAYHLSVTAPGLRGATYDKELVLKPDETRDLGAVRPEWWGRKAVPGLVKELQKPGASDREYAANLLGSLGADAAEAVPALVGRLKDDPANTVRYSAARALGQIGPDATRAVPDLVKALEEDAGGGVRREAATALGLIGEPSAAAALRKFLAHPDTDVQRAAAEAVGRLEEAAKRRPFAP
jgi:protocatechuate 3,4-dioxygenase beta subunit